MNIDISSCENFYNTYHKYVLNLFNIDFSLKKNYKYVFFCRDSDEIFCLEGGSMEEIYYKILFKIDYNSCDDIYVYINDSVYSMDDLADPVQLLKNHYFDNDNSMYVFQEVKFINSGLDFENKTNININIKIKKNSAKEFYESYKIYTQLFIQPNILSTINKYQYIFISREFADIYFIEGNSLEELYYIIYFKLDEEFWDNVYDCNYPIKELKDPIKLFKTHFLESDEYIFEPIIFL